MSSRSGWISLSSNLNKHLKESQGEGREQPGNSLGQERAAYLGDKEAVWLECGELGRRLEKSGARGVWRAEPCKPLDFSLSSESSRR